MREGRVRQLYAKHRALSRSNPRHSPSVSASTRHTSCSLWPKTDSRDKSSSVASHNNHIPCSASNHYKGSGSERDIKGHGSDRAGRQRERLAPRQRLPTAPFVGICLICVAAGVVTEDVNVGAAEKGREAAGGCRGSGTLHKSEEGGRLSRVSI